jgi:hypothetical protein
VVADDLAVAAGVRGAERADRHPCRDVRGNVVDDAGAERGVVSYLDVLGDLADGVEPQRRELGVAVDPETAADGDDAGLDGE